VYYSQFAPITYLESLVFYEQLGFMKLKCTTICMAALGLAIWKFLEISLGNKRNSDLISGGTLIRPEKTELEIRTEAANKRLALRNSRLDVACGRHRPDSGRLCDDQAGLDFTTHHHILHYRHRNDHCRD
jgi:hypothetical protein